MSAAERKALIVTKAVDLFSQHGFGGTTTRELAAQAGITEPVLYQHFSTKRALYDAILEAKAQEYTSYAPEFDALSESSDSRAFFARLAEVILDFYLVDPRYPRLLMYAALEGHDLSQLFYERHVAVFYDVITRHLQRQMDRGLLRPMDPLATARSFAGMLVYNGLIFAIFQPGQLAVPREELVQTAVDIFLKGVTV